MMKFLIVLCFSWISWAQAQSVEKHHSGDTIQWKNYILNNNQWGQFKIKKGTYTQTIFTSDSIVGWRWTVPQKSYGVLGYPMLSLGVSPWGDLSQLPAPNFYKNLKNLQEFEVEYDTDLLTTKGKYNLAFDFWLHDQPKVGFESITAEIMIWEDYQKFKPFGKKKGILFTSDGNYEIYIGDLYKKELQKGWKYIAFVRQQKRTKGKLNLMPFIHYILKQPDMTKAIYLSSFEFGTEVLNASGQLKLFNYDVKIQ